MQEVLVNRLGGLSLPRKSVVRLTDRADMTLDVYRGRKTTIQQQHVYVFNRGCSGGRKISISIFLQVLYGLYNEVRVTDIKLRQQLFNPPALRKAKIAYNFGLSECNRVKVSRG